MPVTAARDGLRDAWARWGLPDTLRLDNGYPWGHANGLPTALALWVAGLGVTVIFNPPRRPRDNGVVERSHGVTSGWAEAWTCSDVKTLQARIDDLDQIQREEYPQSSGRTRRDLFAALWTPRRRYTPQGESEQWQESWARSYLGQRVARRKVDTQGKVTIYARSYHVGLTHRGQEVVVEYEADTGEWIFSNPAGVQWCRQPAEQICQERIMALDISSKPSKNLGQRPCPD